MAIEFFKKNKIDIDRVGVTITVTDLVADNNGQASVDFIRNRNNTSGWMTTNSTDAAGTEIEIRLTERQDVSDILLVKNNFKSFWIKYWDGEEWVDFSTPINETVNAKSTNRYSFTKVSASGFLLHVSATQVPNADKSLCQMILTESLGALNCQPVVKPVIDKGRKATRYLSGKRHITKSIASFAVDIQMNNVVSDADLTLIEALFDSFHGFLVWLSGGNSSQYPTQRMGYRLEDIYLMSAVNEYEPAWEDGHHAHGMPIDLRLVEVN